VPGLTDNDEWLEALGKHISKYSVVEKVELLPYHTMGTFKYEKLGIAYPLQGVEPLSAERLANAKAIVAKESNKPV
jgi:pyruvate formate lyase activating enzyme